MSGRVESSVSTFLLINVLLYNMLKLGKNILSRLLGIDKIISYLTYVNTACVILMIVQNH